MIARRRSNVSARHPKPESTHAQRLDLFGPALLLEGEDAAAYDEFVARLFAAVKPVDVVYEIFMSDVATLEFEILRLSSREIWSDQGVCSRKVEAVLKR
ncbi:MAG TPA: hypothetical protein VFM05_12625 [Candidatus Saccharimonadales bacterium]|nr:hypothetical protein [Candidatus Saccharimonadales bacterium]